MVSKCESDRGRCKVDIPFTPDESARFRAFLKATGRKAGPWVRTLILARTELHEFGDEKPGENLASFGNWERKSGFINRLVEFVRSEMELAADPHVSWYGMPDGIGINLIILGRHVGEDSFLVHTGSARAADHEGIQK